MIRIKNCELRIMALAALFIIQYSLFTPQIHATESSPSSSIKEKLKTLQDQIASKAAIIQSEVSKKLQNKVYLGTIKSKSTDEIILLTKKGEKRIIINELTDYLPKSPKLNISLLKENDPIAALGELDNEGVLSAKRIVKLKGQSDSQRSIFFGVVEKKSPLTIKTKDNQTLLINTSSQTKFKYESLDAGMAEVKETKPIVVVGIKDSSGKITARFIYILPYTTNLKVKAATESAKISTTSAKKR